MSYFDTYTIYDHPLDYPDHWVVRAWRIETGREPRAGMARLADSLKEARDYIPIAQQQLHRIDRAPDDDATIVETWV